MVIFLLCVIVLVLLIGAPLTLYAGAWLVMALLALLGFGACLAGGGLAGWLIFEALRSSGLPPERVIAYSVAVGVLASGWLFWLGRGWMIREGILDAE